MKSLATACGGGDVPRPSQKRPQLEGAVLALRLNGRTGTHTLGDTVTHTHIQKVAISGEEMRRVFCTGFQRQGLIPHVEGPWTKDKMEGKGIGLYMGPVGAG